MKTKNWLIGCFIIIILLSIAVINLGYTIDPYFVYHKPLTDKYYYSINNQRSQNPGIVKHFDYDAIISGSSMTVQFKTSEAERLFGYSFVKVPFFGGSFKEINDCISIGLENNDNIKLVIRGLDMNYFMDDKDTMRTDLGDYPTYLYDNNPLNDIKYLLNKDVQFGISYNMISDSRKPNSPIGITDFDDYTSPPGGEQYGKNAILSSIDINLASEQEDFSVLSDEEKRTIIDNITQNVTAIADKYPEVSFYYFFPPYSLAYWMEQNNNGSLYKQLEAEKIVIDLIIQHKNIKLFSFNTKTDITSNLNNYYDSTHYGPWVNSLILKWLKEGSNEITIENLQNYLALEQEIITNYNYSALCNQEDYEIDQIAEALANVELTGLAPIDALTSSMMSIESQSAVITGNDVNKVVKCKGNSYPSSNTDASALDILDNDEYVGIKLHFKASDRTNYLVFSGQKLTDEGHPSVYVYDSTGTVLGALVVSSYDIDYSKHQYLLSFPSADNEEITVLFNGGGTDDSSSPNSEYEFSEIYIY